MSNALHDYAKLFEKYAAANGGWGVILAGEDCLSLANEMMIDADTLEADNDRLREQVHLLKKGDILHVLTDQEYIDQCERERLMQVSIDALDKENAKLRELVDYMTPIALYAASEQERDCMRELGVDE